MSETMIKTQAFKLKGRLFTFTVLQLLSTDKEILSEQLSETVMKAPKLFDKTPVVLDLSAITHLECDLQKLCQMIRGHGMIPVAIQGGNAFQETRAHFHDLAVLNSSTSQDKPIIERGLEQNTYEPSKAKLLTAPVRSGQQVVSKGSDLIVTSSVSHGAELLSDGNIHVYGALRGRALAGISGDLEARIFCHSLEAELVSIAGFYRLSDAIEPMNGPCQIYLLDEHIVIESL